MIKYWIAVASKEHVMRGVEGRFCQVCHGKGEPLKRMNPGDWIIYYSPTEKFGESSPCRQFTAIGQITDHEPYKFQMSDDFIPWRRNVNFQTKAKSVAIEPLIDKLSFIINKQRWGFPFRRGCLEISAKDFQLIALSMGVILNE